MFFFNDTATTEIYTLSLHDALPISRVAAPRSKPTPGQGDLAPSRRWWEARRAGRPRLVRRGPLEPRQDRKSTRLNSSHANISYAVFCLKKKKNHKSIKT